MKKEKKGMHSCIKFMRKLLAQTNISTMKEEKNLAMRTTEDEGSE